MKKSKDIYEHLAKVYFDSSRNKKKDYAHHKSLFKNLFQLSIAVIVCLVIVLMVTIFRQKQESLPQSQVALILEANTTRINYDFNQAEKEAAVFNLNDMNLLGFRTLAFRVRQSNYQDNLHMSVEFISDFAEKSHIYIKRIPARWQDFIVDLAEFNNISDWSRMRQLSFVLEEWNAQTKEGIVYIDNVYFLK